MNSAEILRKKISEKIPDLTEKLGGLGELAYNLWWSWHPEARMLFKMLDRQLWKESLHNPVKMLKGLPAEVLESAASNSDYGNWSMTSRMKN